MRALLCLLLIAGCAEPEENFGGSLVRVEVVMISPGCTPSRFTGDAGLQFFGQRPDGGILFTMGQQAQFGPAVDGGVLPGVQRQLIPSPNGGRAQVGTNTACVGTFSNWEPTDAGLRLVQDFPGQHGCPGAPDWLPLNQCSTTRLFNFTEVGTCELRCVRLSGTSGEVECSC